MLYFLALLDITFKLFYSKKKKNKIDSKGRIFKMQIFLATRVKNNQSRPLRVGVCIYALARQNSQPFHNNLLSGNNICCYQKPIKCIVQSF